MKASESPLRVRKVIIPIFLKSWYVYYHYADNKLIYIGMGSNGRALDTDKRSDKWKKIISEARTCNAQIIKYFTTAKEARIFEADEIRRLRPIANTPLYLSSRNKRNNVLLTLHGRSQIASDWAKELGINEHTISIRKWRGMSDKDALSVIKHNRFGKRLVFNHKKETLSLPQWANKLGIKYGTLYYRIVLNGEKIEDAFNRPVSNSKK